MNPASADAIQEMAQGLDAEMIRQGRRISSIEIAAVVLAASFIETAEWLQHTLDWSQEERLQQAQRLINEADAITKEIDGE